MIEVNKKEFYETIKNNDIVIADFFAEWCGPCQMLAPLLKKMSGDEKLSHITFIKIDVDKEKELSKEVGIRAMPTMNFYYKGEKKNHIIGFNTKETILNVVNHMIENDEVNIGKD